MFEEKILFDGKIHPDYKKKTIIKDIILWPIICFFSSVPFSSIFILMKLLLIVPFNVPLFIILIIIFGLVVSFLSIIGGSIISYLYNGAYIRNFMFQIREKTIIIKYGVFNHVETTIPYNRIQNLRVSSGILDKKFNLFNISFKTEVTNECGPPRGETSYKAKDLIPGQKNPTLLENILTKQLVMYSK